MSENMISSRSEKMEPGLYAAAQAPRSPSVRVASKTISTTEQQTITWTPNHPDGSSQSAFQIEISHVGDSATTTVNGTTATSETLAPNTTTGQWSARVRTKGSSSEWGAWSNWITWVVSKAATVSITTPSRDHSTVDSAPFDVKWSVSSESGISLQRIEIKGADNATYYSSNVPTNVFAWSVDKVFISRASYTIHVIVQNGDGLSTTAKRAFNAVYASASRPTSTITTEHNYGAYVNIKVKKSSSGDTVKITVDRISDTYGKDNTETITRISGDLQDGDAIKDMLAPLGVKYKYRINAYNKVGAVASSTVEYMIEKPPVYIFSYGNKAENYIALSTCKTDKESGEISGDSYYFDDGGYGLPKFYPLNQANATHEYEFHIKERSDYDFMRHMQRYIPLVWVRDPFGHVFRARVTINLSANPGKPTTWEASVKATEDRWEEPSYE